MLCSGCLKCILFLLGVTTNHGTSLSMDCKYEPYPFIPTSRRSWTHTQAQTHFVCCTTHVVSDEGRGVSGDGVAEEFSDCSEYFEVTRKRKKKWNRAAAALKMSCKSSSQVDSHAPPHQPSTNKRKGKREIRPGLNRRRRQEPRASDGRTIAHKTCHGNSGARTAAARGGFAGVGGVSGEDG